MTLPIDPIGLNTYRGLAVPTYGESAIRQQNSSNAIISMMHSSLNTGPFMLGMDYEATDPVDSSRQGLALWDIDADGHFRALSGTTVAFRIGADGLYAGGNSSLLIDAAKGYRINTQRVTTVAPATTGVAVTSADSGMLYVQITAAGATTCQYTLTATPAVGDFYDFFFLSSAASDMTVKTAATGDAQGFKHYKSTAAFLTTAAIGGATSGVAYFRCTALTSGSLWLVENLYQTYTTATWYGKIVAASTST